MSHYSYKVLEAFKGDYNFLISPRKAYKIMKGGHMETYKVTKAIKNLTEEDMELVGDTIITFERPLLLKEEWDFLKFLTKNQPLRKKDCFVVINSTHSTLSIIYTVNPVDKGIASTIDAGFIGLYFNGLIPDYKYSLEMLGL